VTRNVTTSLSAYRSPSLPQNSYTTAELIHRFSNALSDKVKPIGLRAALKNGAAIALLAGILFFPPLGAHATRAIYTARLRIPKPTPHVAKTFAWIKAELPQNSVVTAHWAYGSQLNVLAGVKTITDQDTYLQNWILLYYQHVHNATSESEALEYLKTHGATHLMLTGKDPKDSFLRGTLSEAFVPIYPRANFADAPIKTWEIHYPPDIQTDPKYLKTGFPEIDKNLPLQ